MKNCEPAASKHVSRPGQGFGARINELGLKQMVLEDHKRRGRKLVPPMCDSPVQETRWHAERLPELFWIAFVGKRLGDAAALEAAYQMAVDIESTIKRLRGNEHAFRAYLASDHLSCSADERQQVLSEHRDSTWFRQLHPHFSEMTTIWPDLPFSYLASSSGDQPKQTLVSEIKSLLRECFHRHNKRSLIIQATCVALKFRTAKLLLARGLEIPDINAVFDYPDTEESKHAAGFVVTTCSGMIMHRSGPQSPVDLAWQRTFWNRCFRLESCEYE